MTPLDRAYDDVDVLYMGNIRLWIGACTICAAALYGKTEKEWTVNANKHWLWHVRMR